MIKSIAISTDASAKESQRSPFRNVYQAELFGQEGYEDSNGDNGGYHANMHEGVDDGGYVINFNEFMSCVADEDVPFASYELYATFMRGLKMNKETWMQLSKAAQEAWDLIPQEDKNTTREQPIHSNSSSRPNDHAQS